MTEGVPEVAVNLLWCVPGDVGGSEQYLVRQLLGLVEAEAGRDRLRPTAYVVRGFASAHRELAAAMPTVTAPVDGRNRLRRIATETYWLPRRVRGAALVHHGGGSAPLRTPRPYVLTVHDLQYRTYPQYFSAAKRRYLATLLPRSVERAAAITVPSEYVRHSVVEAFGVSPDVVHVVPHGVEPSLGAGRAPAAELRDRLALGDGPVLVYPAVTHPHKNHRLLVELMASRWRDPDLRLVCIGGRGRSEPEVVAAAAADPRIRRLGIVSDADRDGLLALADALVFPSLYEGFGAPVIEAMALGTPVVASDATCLPDVVSDAGVVRPPTVDAWADVLDEVRARRAVLVAAGARRAARFTSAASGAALADAYLAALGRA